MYRFDSDSVDVVINIDTRHANLHDDGNNYHYSNINCSNDNNDNNDMMLCYACVGDWFDDFKSRLCAPITCKRNPFNSMIVNK